MIPIATSQSSIHLTKGVNAIGVSIDVKTKDGKIKSKGKEKSFSDAIDSFWEFDEKQQKWNKIDNYEFTLKPGKGYLLYANEEGELAFDTAKSISSTLSVPSPSTASPTIRITAPSTGTLTTTSTTQYITLDLTSLYNELHTNAFPEGYIGYNNWFTKAEITKDTIPFKVNILPGKDIVAFNPRAELILKEFPITTTGLISEVYILYGCAWCAEYQYPLIVVNLMKDSQVVTSRLFPAYDWSTDVPKSSMPQILVESFGAKKVSGEIIPATVNRGNIYLAKVTLDTPVSADTIRIKDAYINAQLAVVAVTVKTTPTITITSPTEGATVTTAVVSVAFTPANIPPDKKIKAYVDGTAQVQLLDPKAISYSTPSLGNAQHNVKFEVVNADGSSLSPTIITPLRSFTVAVPPGPSIIITSPKEGATVTTARPEIRFTTTNAAGKKIRVSVDFNKRIDLMKDSQVVISKDFPAYEWSTDVPKYTLPSMPPILVESFGARKANGQIVPATFKGNIHLAKITLDTPVSADTIRIKDFDINAQLAVVAVTVKTTTTKPDEKLPVNPPTTQYITLDLTSLYNQPHKNAFPEGEIGYNNWFTKAEITKDTIPFKVKILPGNDIVAFNPRDVFTSKEFPIPTTGLISEFYILYGCGWCADTPMMTFEILEGMPTSFTPDPSDLLINGKHTVKVEIVEPNPPYNSLSPAVSATVSFEVNVPSPSSLPTITITSPTEGAKVTTATPQIQFKASNAAGKKIKVFVDTIAQANPLDSSATIYTTSSLPNGLHTVKLEVVETNGASLTPPVVTQLRSFTVKRCTKVGEIICKPGNIITLCNGLDQEFSSEPCYQNAVCDEKYQTCLESCTKENEKRCNGGQVYLCETGKLHLVKPYCDSRYGCDPVTKACRLPPPVTPCTKKDEIKCYNNLLLRCDGKKFIESDPFCSGQSEMTFCQDGQKKTSNCGGTGCDPKMGNCGIRYY